MAKRAELSITSTEEPAAIIPMVSPPSALSSQNESFYGKAIRRFRELLVEAQKRRVEGSIKFECQITDGKLTGNVVPFWKERLE